jgi:hypothetical protein
MKFKEFKTESSEDPLYFRRGVSKARNIGIVGPIERAFCLRSTFWPHVTKKRPERIKVVPITQPRKRDSPRMKVPKIDASIGITGAYAATKIGP